MNKANEGCTVQIQIFCSGSFEGFHCWPAAPEEVAFLRDRHRHRFHWKVWWNVTHHDRDKEFILLQRAVAKSISEQQANAVVETWSCESWCQWLLDVHDACRVEVNEDLENGSVVTRI